MRIRPPKALHSLLASSLVLAFGAAAPSASGDAAPQSPPPARAAERSTELERCLEMAERNHPNIWGARARLKGMEAQLDEARWTPFSMFTVTGGVGLAPTLRGNAMYSPNTDVSLSSSMGVGWRVGIDGLIPIWTFGKLSNLSDAADAQAKVGEGDIVKQKALVRMDVRKAFFGLLLARGSIRLVGDVIEKLDRAIEHVEKEIQADNADPIDALRLRTLRFELEGRQAEARRYETIALASLRFLVGQPTGFDITSEALHPSKRALGPVAQYLSAARLHRPEVNMLRAGMLARQAQVRLNRAKYFPDLGVGVSAVWARAPEMADQLNPYIRDDANYFRYGAALALRWQLDILPNAARVRQAEAQLEELRATERFALGGIGVEVETAYAQVRDAAAREQAYGMAEKTARQWLVAIQQGIDVGTKDDADLVDAARQLALQRFAHLTAVMDLNVAWSNLALTTGCDDLAPPGG
jgi:outer membrane protein TolC